MPKLEQRFDYVKIGLASPDRIREWGFYDFTGGFGLVYDLHTRPPV